MNCLTKVKNFDRIVSQAKLRVQLMNKKRQLNFWRMQEAFQDIKRCLMLFNEKHRFEGYELVVKDTRAYLLKRGAEDILAFIEVEEYSVFGNLFRSGGQCYLSSKNSYSATSALQSFIEAVLETTEKDK